MRRLFSRPSRRKQRERINSAVLESLENRQMLSTYYVSNSGSDSAAGSASAPWATLQNAANHVAAGDTVIVQPGKYAGFVLGWNYPQNGTANAPITFQAQPGAIITSRNYETQDGINLAGASYVTIQGFKIDNEDGSITRAGIRAVDCSNVIIQNNNTTGNGTWGIYTSHASNTTIQNNTTSYNNALSSNTWNHHGIYVSNSAVDPIVRNNVVFGNWGNGIHFNGDATQGGTGIVTGAIVTGNIIYDNGANGGSAINCDGVQNSIIQNNLLYNNHAKGIALYQIDAYAPSVNNIVENNTVVQGSGAQAALNVLDGSTGNQIRNNTLLGGAGSFNMDAASAPGTISDYNVGTAAAVSGSDTHSIFNATTSQLFANPTGGDYHLVAGSPAIDHGTATNAPNADLDGKPRPVGAGYDIGAYEYQTSAPAPTPTVPAAPSALSATAGSSTRVNLKWTDNSTNETGYKVSRAIGTGALAQIATLGVGATSFTDSTALASTQYTYQVSSYNSAGSSSPASASVTTPTAGVISQSIWSNTATPQYASVVDPNSVELGLKFTSTAAGYITGIRFYKGPTNTGTHIVHLWNSAGQLIASATSSGETASGWQTVNFASPVAISANTTYTASYYTSSGNYADTDGYFNSGAYTSGALTALNSVYTYTQGAFPASTWNGDNYWVDVNFTNQAPTVALPAAPSALGATAASSTQVNLKWTDNSTNETGFAIERSTAGSAFAQIATVGAGVTSYSNTGLTAGTAYAYRVRAYNSAGYSAYSNTASVSTPAAASTSSSIWTSSTTPQYASVNDPNAAELGLKISSTTGGYITGIRFYKGPTNTGTHIVHLWNSSGQLLATATSSNETASGWQTVNFATPVYIAANTTYTASYYTSSGNYADTDGYFNNGPYTNGSLTALGSVYTYTNGAFPSATWNGCNYWVDVNFSTVTPAIATSTATSTSTSTSVWPNTTTPAMPAAGDPSALELGMQFQSSVAGYVTGARFYKSATNTGTHVANLWDANGNLLASATFTNETASGWQSVNFSSPVYIAANKVYTISYHTNTGNYSYNTSYFSNGPYASGSLAALQGVYTYSSSSVFPGNSYLGTNYWVDLQFATA